MKNKGILQKILELTKTMSQKQEKMKEKANSGDLNVWHRILMGVVLTFVAVFLVGAVFVQYLLDRQKEELKNQSKIVSLQNIKLTADSYNILALHKINNKMSKLTPRDYVMVSASKGGIVMTVSPLEEIAIPKDFYDPECYKLKVAEDGKWEFEATEHLKEMKVQK